MKRTQQFGLLVFTLIVVGVTYGSVTFGASHGPSTVCKQTDPFCFEPHIQTVPAKIETISLPKIATPVWLAAQGAQTQTQATREISYTIASKGTTTTNLDEFAAQVNQTLNNPEGWSRLGVRFVEVDSDGQFVVWLSEAAQVPSFAPGGCDAIVSCTVGNNVIINETRWVNGSDAWNAASGTLRDYQHMVLNHEAGHWLGHGHEYCSAPGAPAAVMQQQTLDMQGCSPNPWPLAHEIFAPKLGIRS